MRITALADEAPRINKIDGILFDVAIEIRLTGKEAEGVFPGESPSQRIVVSGAIKAAQQGRIAAQQPQVLARLGEKQRIHRAAELAWKPEDKPVWLDETVYTTQVHPRLAHYSISRIAMALGVSFPYASDIRAGRKRPHRQRHWLALAKLAGILDVG